MSEHAPHPGEAHRFDTTCKGCGTPGRLHVALLGDDEGFEILSLASLPDRALADALLVWYDTTHGNRIGEHDHHCLADAKEPGPCTCGWDGVVQAERARAKAMPCDDCGRTDGTHDPEVEH